MKTFKITNDEFTESFLKDWYGKEKILDNALIAMGKKLHRDSEDPYFSRINEKISYLNQVLEVYGFKNMLDFETVIERNSELVERMKSKNWFDKSSYGYIMQLFDKVPS